MLSLRITADTTPLEATIKEMASLLEFSLNLTSELRQALLDLLQSPLEVFSLDTEPNSATGTGEIRVLFKPSDALRNALAALRAGHGQPNASV